MQMQLSQKERMILEDEKHQEGICIKKYQNYAEQCQDQQLKQIFNKLSGQEQHHYNIIDQMLQGQQPDLSHNQMNSSQQPQQQTSQNQMSSYNGAMKNTGDEILCSDLLATEKYVSGTYDTGIFEAANPTVRQALKHIQQEEQQHGEELFNYMSSHGMYNVK